jgi:hypothetical protein
MKTVEIPLMRITGQPNIRVACDDVDFPALLNFVSDYQSVVNDLESLREDLELYA